MPIKTMPIKFHQNPYFAAITDGQETYYTTYPIDDESDIDDVIDAFVEGYDHGGIPGAVDCILTVLSGPMAGHSCRFECCPPDEEEDGNRDADVAAGVAA